MAISDAEKYLTIDAGHNSAPFIQCPPAAFFWTVLLPVLLLITSPLLSQTSSAGSAAEADKIFAARCAICHGAEARGGQYGPALIGNNDLRGKPDSWIRDLIRKGVPSAGMPAFDLKTDELDAVAALIHSMNSPATENAVPGDRDAGEHFFFGQGKCAGCHMAEGHGSAMGPDLSNVGRDLTVADIRESLLQPGSHIAAGYALVTVQLHSGRSLHGFARSQSNFELVLQDMKGDFHLLPQDEIATVKQEKQSAMPALEASPEELQNLVAYLSGLSGVKPDNAKAAEPSVSEGIPFSRILDAHPGDWLTYNGNLSGNRFSELNQINTTNVKHLQLNWIYTVPLWQQFYPDSSYFRENLSYFGLETTPLVADGILYGTGPQQAFALDARTGKLVWRYSRPMPPGLVGDASLGSNRGLAILGDKLFMATSDAHVIALNRVNGQVVWEAVMPEKPMHYGATVAPLVVKDMVIAGVAGADWGIRGFLAAYRVSDGKLLWRRWTIPDKSDPEAKTWGGNPPETGGASTWVTGSYDPETDTLFWTTGNPYPDSDDRDRPGDNLYSNCILALDPNTGKIKWFYQVTPHDVHDWDATAPVVLVDTKYQGQQKKLLLYANKNGFFYVFDRTNGHILVAQPFVKVNWASGIGRDGRPQRMPEDGVLCPEAGTNWGATAFSPLTQLYYLVAYDKCNVDLSAGSRGKQPVEEEGKKYLEALEIQNGKVMWRVPQLGSLEGKRNAGILATSGGLLFYADPSGNVVAADATDGKPLWHFTTNGESKASPVTYTVGGKQFVGLAVGPNILSFSLP